MMDWSDWSEDGRRIECRCRRFIGFGRNPFPLAPGLCRRINTRFLDVGLEKLTGSWLMWCGCVYLLCRVHCLDWGRSAKSTRLTMEEGA
ncbi:hypothetical protein P280DRAFT_199232 [Massarina eburnea CBS 473.64]|uniref:Uncharacterized protein n=1 Tax=Massarina eburnea CBS 473.64 TaxID=1395130 RepID=A0A6A6RHY3_9PLEO|nr:hypothetical protein P280DRAFT_199232 [Massarina eburnea CBS 473.64]